MKIKDICKRVITFSLAATMSLTSLFSVYAEDGVNGGGSGSQNEGGDFEYCGAYHIYHVNQGIRMYIMNSDGTIVSNTVDMVQYLPQDFAGGAVASKEKFKYMTETYQNKIGFWNKNKNAELNRNDPMWKNNYNTIVYLGGGKKDNTYARTFDNLMAPTSGVKCIKRSNYDKNSSGFNSDSNTEIVPGKMYLYSDVEQFIRYHILGQYGDTVESPIDENGGTYTYERDGQTITISKKFKNPFHFENWTVGLQTTGEHMKNQLMAPVIDKNTKEELGYTLQVLLQMSMPVSDGKGAIDYTNMKPLFEFFDSRLNQKLQTIKASGSLNPILDLIQQEQLYMGIEPIHWSAFEVTWPSNPYTSAIGANQNAFYSTPYILYGTPSEVYWEGAKMFANFVNANSKIFGGMTAPDPVNDLGNFTGWLEAKGFFTGWEWGQGESCYMLERDEPDLNMSVYNKIAEKHPSFWKSMINGFSTSGYGIMVFSLSPKNAGTPTWDKKTYPVTNYQPGPAPQTTDPDKPDGPYPVGYPSEGMDYRTNNKDHKFNIVKFYAEKNPDGTYEYKSNFTREQTIHDININDEPDYKVDNYFTSSQFKKPENQNDSYDVYKSTLPKGTLEGNKAGKITIKATDPDTTLYVRLVGVPSLTIIKYYPDKSPEVEVVPYQPNYDANEEGYVYEEDKQTPDKTVDDIPPTYEETDGTPGSTPDIPVKEDTKTIYIKYDKPIPNDPDVITLHQNELAHVFSLSDIAELVTQTHRFSSKERSGHDRHYIGDDCRGNDEDGYYCGGHPCSWERYIDDDNYSYVISNKENYSETNFIGANGAFASVEIGVVDDSGSLGIGGGTTSGLTPNLKFALYLTYNKKDKSVGTISMIA